jgi:alkanesulfonate monooxygenase SsuD/methylene tetrahydromethanopterin reductase-like flavin-dependent oxidoreductase (luciferase family)
VKTCFLCPGSYIGKVAMRAWPMPPELCDRQEAARSMDVAIQHAQWAEAAGFDWVSVSEHHYSPGLMTPNPIVLAAAMAQATSRVKIALLGPLVPLINPVRAAEEIAMLDAISHGRVVVLFLRGTPNEHQTYGPNTADTREVTQEGVQLIRRAWTEPKPFNWTGKYFNFDTVSVWPRTVQDPHPPIFYSGNSDESARFAGLNGLSVAVGFAGLETVRRQVGIYKDAAREAGWEPTHDNVLFRGRMIVAEDDAAAEAMAQRIAPGMRTSPVTGAATPGAGGGDPTAGIAGIQFMGGPAAVIARARALQNAGVGILDVAVIGGDMERAMDVFTRKLAGPLREIA